jgi:DNA polymerase-4
MDEAERARPRDGRPRLRPARPAPQAPFGERVLGGGPVPEGELDALRILHADMDAFYASVEINRNPSLAGRPVLVGGPGRRGVVTSASYEARAAGCRNAMPTGMARRLCPEAVVIPPDFDLYRKVSATVMGAFRDVTPLVEPLSLDEAFLDVGGARRPGRSAVDIARALRARVRDETGLAVTVGVAASKFLAKLGSSSGKPDGLFVLPPGRAVAWLHGLPVERLWGVGDATMKVLARYGISTVGQLATTPRPTLEAALGRAAGERLLELAWARDDRPVVPGEAAKSIGSEETFAEDIEDPEVLAREVLRQAVRVGRRLRTAGQLGRTVTLKIRFGDWQTVTRSRTLPGPTDADAELARVAARLLAGLEVGRRPVRLVGVTASQLIGADEPVQLELGVGTGDGRAGGDRAGWEAVDRVADELRDRFGDRAVRLASLLDEPESAFAEAREEPRARRDL